jgi:hypothetical protein
MRTGANFSEGVGEVHILEPIPFESEHEYFGVWAHMTSRSPYTYSSSSSPSPLRSVIWAAGDRSRERFRPVSVNSVLALLHLAIQCFRNLKMTMSMKEISFHIDQPHFTWSYFTVMVGLTRMILFYFHQMKYSSTVMLINRS